MPSTLTQAHPQAKPSTMNNPIFTSDTSCDDDIIRVAAYHRRDIDLTVVNCNPAELEPSLFSSSSPNPVFKLGSLGVLPAELLIAILLQLDLESALRFSHANNSAKSFTADIWEYRKARELAPQCLHAAFRTGVSSSLGVSALYAALVTKGCALCGHRHAFARFFSLLTATQCCLPCLEVAPECAVLRLDTVCKATGRSPGSVRRRVPVLRSVPGSYGWEKTRHTRKSDFVAQAHCSRFLGANCPEPQPRCLLWTAPLIARGILSPSHSWAEPLPERYMAASSIPYLDVAAGGVERGLSCRGCQVAWDDEMEDETEERSGLVMSQVVWNYSREGFLEHFRECDEAQALWSASKGGTVPLEEPEVTMEERYGEL